MKKTSLIFLVFAVAIAVLPLSPVPEFWISLMNYIGIYSIAALGLVLLTGVGGLTSFGQAAFVGIGAYAAAYLSTVHGMSPWATLLVAVALSAAAALAIGVITMRLSGYYLPLGTIAWGIALYYLFGNLEFLGKFDGLNGVPPITLFGIALDSGRAMYGLVWIVVLLAMAGMHNLLDSRPGRAIRALRGGVTMAEAMGVDTTRMKVLIFVYAAVLSGVAGWLYAHLQRSVNPTPFSLSHGIEFLFMAVIGGAGHVAGAVLGAGVLTVLKEILQGVLPGLLGSSGNYEVIVFGILMVLLLQHARDGLWPFVLRWLPASRTATAPDLAPALRAGDKPAAGEAILEVHGVRKQFGGLVAVNDVSFTVKAGEIVGLIGPNGAGKSTTFNLVTGVLGATSGTVNYRGQAITGLASREVVRRGIARTFQHVQMLPSMTVLENVAIGAHLRGDYAAQGGTLASLLRLNRREEAKLLHEARRQLERVGLGAYLYAEAGSLALGQQRIMEIARALCADPALLLLDEPAAGLRYQEKQALAALLDRLRAEGMAVLLVEHDMDFVMNLTDHIVVMEFGTKIAEGTPAAVQSNPAVLAAYLGAA